MKATVNTSDPSPSTFVRRPLGLQTPSSRDRHTSEYTTQRIRHNRRCDNLLVGPILEGARDRRRQDVEERLGSAGAWHVRVRRRAARQTVIIEQAQAQMRDEVDERAQASNRSITTTMGT